ncbi:MAG: translation elongation factor Ts [Chloroflexi bacterium]|nr:translation elongation factor Ts [Chloroflexota bacterium]MCL5273923.1 translation elongation factor Ts [Chloroflexota bacterium]
MATSEQIRILREQTAAGVLDCKKALDAHNGDIEKAAAWLREKGLASAAKKASREAHDGIIEAYSHMGGRMAVLVEVNCETDFVARTPEFKALAHDLALQIASTAPEYIKKDDVPESVIAAKTEQYKQEAVSEGKKPDIAERIAAGRMDKYYQEVCLLEQQFVKDDKVKVSDLIRNAVAKIGENVVVRRFVRYEIGGQ